MREYTLIMIDGTEISTFERDEWRESDFPKTEKGIGSVLRHYRLVDSTNRVARVWASGSGVVSGEGEGAAPHGAVVLADHQTSGRGRQGRTWESSPGQNLLFTVVLRATEPLLSDHVARGMLPLATSLAVASTLASYAGEDQVSIKWPNDVLLGGKKCSGILVEAGVDEVFLIGIGLNVNESEFSNEVGAMATSLLLHSGRRSERRDVFKTLIERLNHWIPKAFEKGAHEVRAAYAQKMAGVGSRITIHTPSESVPGILRGLNSDGGLKVDHNGAQKVYYSGEVSLTHASPD